MSKAFDDPIIMEIPMEIPESLYQLRDVMASAGFEMYIAGGAVRDTILGKSPKDYDIATNATPEDVIRILSPYVKRIGVQGEKSFAVARVIAYDGNEYEFAPYRVERGTRMGGEATLSTKENPLSIKDDAMRRDLTINALFYRIPTLKEREDGIAGEVVDYVGGIDDIKNEAIRTVGDPDERFGEDRLRILRAFRFAGRMGGEVDEETANAIRGNNSLTENSEAAVSDERIQDEVKKGIKTSKSPSHYIDMLKDFDLFPQILPGLKVSKAISSSRNVAVQLATILQENNSSDVANVLFQKKYGNDIKDSVKFLLNLTKLNAESLIGLKRELIRMKKASKTIMSNEAIMDFGGAIGQDFNKFINFASAPPVVSARDLIAGGMKPGPEMGEAIRSAEVDAYFEKNPENTEGISEASSDITEKLIKLSLELSKLGKFSETNFLNNHIIKLSSEISKELASGAYPDEQRKSGWATYYYWESIPGFSGPVVGYVRDSGESEMFDRSSAPQSWDAIRSAKELDAIGGWEPLDAQGVAKFDSIFGASSKPISSGPDNVDIELTSDDPSKGTVKSGEGWRSISDEQIKQNVDFHKDKKNKGILIGWNDAELQPRVREFWRVLTWIKLTFPEFSSAPNFKGPVPGGAVRSTRGHAKALIANWTKAENAHPGTGGKDYFEKYYSRSMRVKANRLLLQGRKADAEDFLTKWWDKHGSKGNPDKTGHGSGDSVDIGPSIPIIGKILNKAKEYMSLEVTDETGNKGGAHYHVGVRQIKSSFAVVDNFVKKAHSLNGDKIENPLNIPIPSLSGEVYIFDMDDTLFWTPEWHTIVETNEEGDATSVDMDLPNMFHKAISFVQKANENHAELIKKDKKGKEIQGLADSYRQEVGNLRLIKRIVDLPMLGKDRQVVFVLSDESGSPIGIPILKKYFSSKNLKAFDLRGKYVPEQAVVAGDAVFYQSPKTLGTIPNEEILNTYKTHSDNAVILTARETREGMAEGIMDRLTSVGLKLPISIFTKPTNISSGKYKAHIIGQIAQQDSVSSIKFYDDNLKYINDVNNILENVYGPDLHSKVTIYRVSVSAKPKESLRVKASNDKVSILKKLITVANELDERGLVEEADYLDNMEII